MCKQYKYDHRLLLQKITIQRKNMTIFIKFQDALDKLEEIYMNVRPDFLWYGYCIRNLTKIGNKYIRTE